MNCLQCGNEISLLKDKRAKFCGHSCSATFNNLKRAQEGYSLKDKKIFINCPDCDCLFETGINSGSRNIRCPECAYDKILFDAYIEKDILCQDCDKIFLGHSWRQYCDKCAHIRIIAGAHNSVSKQKEFRRSKNEIYCAELCIKYFGEHNIKVNEPMFDGWDADIIVIPYKVAILWNGKWHYEKITVKHSVLQVQNRDRIKINKIREYKYIPYVIKDLGSFNKFFVENQFQVLKESILNGNLVQ